MFESAELGHKIDDATYAKQSKKLRPELLETQYALLHDTTFPVIVLVNGITVPQDKRKGHEDLSPPFTTYYEQVDGKYWFPTYTKAEGTLHFAAASYSASNDVHMRNVVKYSDYKQFHATSRIIYNGEDITDKKAPDDKNQKPQSTPPPPQSPH